MPYLDSLLTSKHREADTEPALTLREYHLNMEGLVEDITEMLEWGGDGQRFVINSVLDKIVAHTTETVESVRVERQAEKERENARNISEAR